MIINNIEIERVGTNFTEYDVACMKINFNNNKLSKQDVEDMLYNKEIVKIADRNDYKTAYEDFCNFEKGFDKDTRIEINYGEFVEELKKGYGKSKYVQIARLFELSDGIYYDNEYVD